MLYVVQAGIKGPVKIGYTQDELRFRARFSSLQVGNPEELHVLALVPAAGPTSERKIHKALHRHRIRGEWFAWNAATRRLVAAMQNPSFNADHWVSGYEAACNRLDRMNRARAENSRVREVGRKARLALDSAE